MVDIVDTQAPHRLVLTFSFYCFCIGGKWKCYCLNGVQRVASLKKLTPFHKGSPMRKKSANPLEFTKTKSKTRKLKNYKRVHTDYV